MQRQMRSAVLLAALLVVFFGFFTAEVFALKGADSFGYYYIDSNSVGGPKYVWEDISEARDATKFKKEFQNGSEPDLSGIEIGFDFKFYGREYSSVLFAGNGYITFPPEYHNYVYDGKGIPSADNPNNLIAPFWGKNDAFS